MSSKNVEAIEVEILRPRRGSGDKVPPIETTDPAKIQALMDVFHTASRTSEHKCGDSGVIRIRKKNGVELELSILPGHDAAYYEYRYAGRINRVDRAQFVAALKEIGVENLRLEPP